MKIYCNIEYRDHIFKREYMLVFRAGKLVAWTADDLKQYGIWRLLSRFVRLVKEWSKG